MPNILQRNNVQVSGRGTRPLVFAHGFGCDQRMWRFVAPQFEAKYRVVLFDYVGAGNSDWSAHDPHRYATLEGYKRDLLEVCDALELEDAIFVGHSVSSMVGALASIEAPSLFERLVMVAPSPCFINHAPDYTGGFERADIEGLFDIMDKNFSSWANFLAPLVVGSPDREDIVRELHHSFCSTDTDIARRFAQATFYADNRVALACVTVPSLILQCTDDALVPLSVGHYLKQHLSNSTLRILKAAGHCPHLTQPAKTSRAIRSYLTSQKVASEL